MLNNNKYYNKKINCNLNIENNLIIFKKKTKDIDNLELNDNKIQKNKNLFKQKKQKIIK